MFVSGEDGSNYTIKINWLRSNSWCLHDRGHTGTLAMQSVIVERRQIYGDAKEAVQYLLYTHPNEVRFGGTPLHCVGHRLLPVCLATYRTVN